MSCLKGTGLLNLVFELKLFDVFMGREDSIELEICLPFVLLYIIIIIIVIYIHSYIPIVLTQRIYVFITMGWACGTYG